jgi:hypothetical protein
MLGDRVMNHGLAQRAFRIFQAAEDSQHQRSFELGRCTAQREAVDQALEPALELYWWRGISER